jgi:sulfide:quinone oxidoreductase
VCGVLQTSVVEVLPYESAVLTADGRKVTYKQLVVASGMKQNLDRVKGLREALGRAGVSATSVVPYAHRTWDFVRFFPGGKAVFAEAGGATKLADPLVLAADDYWRRYVGANLYNIKVFTGQNKLFPIPKFEKVGFCGRTTQLSPAQHKQMQRKPMACAASIDCLTLILVWLGRL